MRHYVGRCQCQKPKRVLRSRNCNTLKMVTGIPFGITKIGARLMSIITEGGHEVTIK